MISNWTIKLNSQTIRDWISENDWTSVRDEAHKLAAEGLFGFDDIAHAAKMLEESAVLCSKEKIKTAFHSLISVRSNYTSIAFTKL